MRRLVQRVIVGVLAMAFAGCATLEQRADTAAFADGVTTIAGVGSGLLVEANPLGIGVVAAKIPFLMWADTLPDEERAQVLAAAGPVWMAAAVSNGCMIVAALSGGTFAPVCLVLGAGFGLQQWSENQPELNFYVACAEYRRVSGEQFRCVYKPAAT